MFGVKNVNVFLKQNNYIKLILNQNQFFILFVFNSKTFIQKLKPIAEVV